jgi:thioester reductase-like protein
LYIGGAGLARGYFNRPELTAERFIPNPLISLEAGASVPSRLYKTGDLTRYRADGTIEFLGRSDAQIKLWGFRVELSEIEAALVQHPALRAAAVTVQTDDANHQHLIAYVVTHHGEEIHPDQVRDFLQTKLPYYMLPARLVVLDALPLTPNGKIDRRALPHIDFTESCSGSTFVAPRTPTEATLAKIWTEVLNVKQVGIHDNFFELGGHSLLIVRLFVHLREVFQVDLPLRCLFEAPTVGSLATYIESTHPPNGIESIQPKSMINLDAEAVLEDSINPKSVSFSAIAQPTQILLTGATGFLGAFLLHELLQTTEATIHCFVRATDPDHGMQKIRSALTAYSLWNDTSTSRIIPVIGDLSQPLLGLSENDFRSLAASLDVIYHNGAWVHHTYPYSILKAANVQGTQEILRLATEAKIKPVHFISTISIFADTDSVEKTAFEDSFPSADQVPSNGYIQSKWVAEKLVLLARDRGLPICIYRPGRISGNSQTGVFNRNDFLYQLIIGCVQLGCVPDTEMLLDLIPVDYISRAIIYLSQQQSSIDKAFHLVNPESLPVKKLANWIRSLGYPLESLTYEQWRAKLLHIADHSPDHALYPLVSFFPSQNHLSRSPASSLKIDYQNTLEGLSGTAIACPATDDTLLQTYFSYLIQNNILSAPPTKVM